MRTNKDAVVFLWLVFDHSFSLCTDHSGPGAGRTGEEAEVGLQGGAAHLCHVSRELRVAATQRERERERQDHSLLQDLLEKRSSITYLSSWELQPRTRPGTSLHPQPDRHTTALVCDSLTSFHDGAS